MDTLAQVCAGLSAVILIAVFTFEAFLIDRPWVQKFLAIEPHGIANVHLWSFCIGVRNALAGVGALVGLWMVNRGDESTGTTVVVVACRSSRGPPNWASTGRNRSSAVVPTRSRARCCWSTPGSCTTIESPWRAISGSATPSASTRLRMISIVWSIVSESVGCDGASTTDTPPCRSRPSSGV